MEPASNKSQHTKLSLEKKILPPGFELATFRSRVRCAYQQAIPASWPVCSVELCDQSTAGSPLHAFFNGSLTNPKREGSFLNGPADDDSDMGWNPNYGSLIRVWNTTNDNYARIPSPAAWLSIGVIFGQLLSTLVTGSRVRGYREGPVNTVTRRPFKPCLLFHKSFVFNQRLQTGCRFQSVSMLSVPMFVDDKSRLKPVKFS